MNNIAVFASGSGTNAENLMQYFKNHNTCRIALIISNNKEAKVLERAKKFNVPHEVFTKIDFNNRELILNSLSEYKISFIILAGYLLKIPAYLIQAFPDRIVNIHPALLPKYGGKGMYGMRIHEMVKSNMEKETGITIHLVNENYDEGRILQQIQCSITPNMTAEEIATTIHQLEYRYFPKVVENYIEENL